MNHKRFLAVVIIALLIVIIVSNIELNLYRSNIESNNSTSTVTAGGYNYRATNYANRIGILISDLEKDREIKERQAMYLKNYLLASGYPEVYILQSQEYNGETVDLIITVEMELNLSWLPFYKKGTYEYDIRTLSLHYGPDEYFNEKLTMDYSGQDNMVVYGLISRKKGYDLLLSSASQSFVENLSKQINKNFGTSYAESLEKIKLGRTNIQLRNKASDDLMDKYGFLIPETAEELFIYHDQRMGERAVITYTSDMGIDELVESFGDLNFENYVGGRKLYQSPGFIDKLIIDIKYREDRRYFHEGEELDKKIVTIFYWEKADILNAISDLEGYSSSISDLEQISTVSRGNQDFHYYYSLMKIQFLRLQANYWQDDTFDEKLLSEVLEISDHLANFSDYPGASQYYKAGIYEKLGTMLRSNDCLVKAVQLYQELEANYGELYFGNSASQRLLAIKAHPFYKEKDYAYVLQMLDSETFNNAPLTKDELLFRMGRYEEAYQECVTGWAGDPFRLIIMNKTGRTISQEEFPGKLNGNINDIRWTLTRAFIFKKSGKAQLAHEEISTLRERSPEWRIYLEADELSLRMGFEYDLIEYLNDYF